MSDYKKMMGFEKTTKIIKKQPKQKENKLVENLKNEFGEIDEALPAIGAAIARGAVGLAKGVAKGAAGLAKGAVKTAAGTADKIMSQKDDEDEKKEEDKDFYNMVGDLEIEEGPAYEYKRDIKNIDKSYKMHAKSVLNFYEKLRKKGLDKEASDLLDTYKKNYVTFKKQYDKIISKLL